MSKKAKTPREIFFQSLYDEYNSPGSYEREMAMYMRRATIAIAVFFITPFVVMLFAKLNLSLFSILALFLGAAFLIVTLARSPLSQKHVILIDLELEDMLSDYFKIKNEISADEFSRIYIEQRRQKAREKREETARKYGITK